MDECTGMLQALRRGIVPEATVICHPGSMICVINQLSLQYKESYSAGKRIPCPIDGDGSGASVVNLNLR